MSSYLPKLNAGDTLLLCRGGAWDMTDTFPRIGGTNCSASNANSTCDMRDYGNASLAKPRINAPPGIIHGLDIQSSFGSDLPAMGYRFLNLDFEGPSQSQWTVETDNTVGIFIYGNITNLEICNVTTNMFGIGVQIAGPYNPSSSVTTRTAPHDLTLQGNTITNMAGHGFLGNADSLQLNYNKFDGDGWCGGMDSTGTARGIVGLCTLAHPSWYHSIYLGGESDGEQIIGNQMTHSVTNSPANGATGSCQGPPVVVHGAHSNLTVEGNYIYEAPTPAASDGCYGISIADGGYDPSIHEEYDNVWVRRNQVYNTGNQGIGLDECQTCLVENNLVVMNQPGNAIGAPIMAGAANTVAANKAALNAITIRNNTVVYTSTGAGVGIMIGHSILGDGSHHVVANNVVFNEGSGSVTCMLMNQATINYDFIDNNACYGANKWESSHSLSQWQALNFDLSSFMSAVLSQPAFNDPSTYDFSTASGSQLWNTGSLLRGSSFDISGKLRPASANPDIGAFQH